MPLGILESRYGVDVPGTAPLEVLANATYNEHASNNIDDLKHDKTGRFILIPQPSNDPQDPLNWSRWRKEMFIFATIWGVGCVGAIGPLLGAAYVQLAEEWDVSLSRFTSGTNGALIVCLAGATPLSNLLAVKYGKRPVYLGAGLGLLATGFWGSAAESFGSFIASRAIAGVCMAPMEALVPASIADVWFTHERGVRMALFNLGFMTGISIGPLIAGQLIQAYSWRACSYAMAGALAVSLILTFLFMPETAYNRAQTYGTSSSGQLIAKDGSSVEHVDNPVMEPNTCAESKVRQKDQPNTATSRSTSKKVLLGQLSVWSGYRKDISSLTILLGPFKMLRSPIVIWAAVVYMTAITWLVMLTVGVSQIFTVAPYHFSIAAVGNTFLSPFVASVLGSLIAGPLIDGGVKLLSRKNKGIFEPEFRLPVFAAYVLFTATGFFSAGQSLGLGLPWPVPVILSIGLINFGVILSITVAIAYVIDCHREQASEAVSMMVLIKNMFAFGSTYYINDWIASQGVRTVFFILGGITLAIGLSGIPLYIMGKRLRAFTARMR